MVGSAILKVYVNLFIIFSGCSLTNDIAQQTILLYTSLSFCGKLSISTHWCPLEKKASKNVLPLHYPAT